jgi:WhiB family transcriptional regulator, redox-sensing transcriptional regulator
MTLSNLHFISAYESDIPYPDFHSKGPALCTQLDSELYFPEGQGTRTTQSLAIKAICYECPYRAECLEWAVVNREDGIWGGTNNAERAVIRGGMRSRSDNIKVNRVGNKTGREYTTRPKKKFSPPASFDLTGPQAS